MRRLFGGAAAVIDVWRAAAAFIHASRAATASLAGTRSVIIASVSVALSGCAGTPPLDLSPPASLELAEVPFFPQTDYQCGPAALATLLAHEGVLVTPDDLAPSVYVEGLRGSLQAELLAATRRRGLVPYVLEPDPAALFAALESDKPVLVLQNLGLPRLPIWHYAVVVGYDAQRGTVLLRSGTERRRNERLRRFLKSWQRANQWAFVAAEPAEPPPMATPERWIRALADAERMLSPDAAAAAYAAAKARWPNNPLVLFASGVHAGAAGRWVTAVRDYGALLAIEPTHAAARNNLAHMLAEGGCITAALYHARAALDALTSTHPLRAAVEDSVHSIARQAENMSREPMLCEAFAPPVELMQSDAAAESVAPRTGSPEQT